MERAYEREACRLDYSKYDPVNSRHPTASHPTSPRLTSPPLVRLIPFWPPTNLPLDCRSFRVYSVSVTLWSPEKARSQHPRGQHPRDSIKLQWRRNNYRVGARRNTTCTSLHRRTCNRAGKSAPLRRHRRFPRGLPARGRLPRHPQLHCHEHRAPGHLARRADAHVAGSPTETPSAGQHAFVSWRHTHHRANASRLPRHRRHARPSASCAAGAPGSSEPPHGRVAPL